MLFADLESRLSADGELDRLDRVRELTRVEAAQVSLVDRLRSAVGQHLTVRTCLGEPVAGEVEAVASTWLLLRDGARQHVVAVAAVESVTGALGRASAPRQDVASRLSVGHALRALARDRVRVVVRTRSTTVVGRVERVGSDHLDVGVGASWDGDDAGPRGAGQHVTVVPFAALVVVSDGQR